MVRLPGACADCCAYLRNYEEAVRAGKIALAGTDEDVPDSVPEQLLQAILASRLEQGG